MIEPSLEGIEQFGGVAQGEGVGRGEVLAAQPVLQLGVPLRLQRALGELHHQQGSFHVQPVEEALVSGSVAHAAPSAVPLQLLLHQVLPWAPQEALQDPLGLLDVDALDGVGLQEEVGESLESRGVQGERRDRGQVLGAVVLLLQCWTHLEGVGLVEEFVDQDARLELVKLPVLGCGDDLGSQSGVVAFDARIAAGGACVFGGAALGLGKVADEQAGQVALNVCRGAAVCVGGMNKL